MTDEHLATLMRWMDLYEDIGLGFEPVNGDTHKATYKGMKYPPLSLEINLITRYGHVESGGDFETNHNGSTRFGTMWDEDESERYYSSMPFEDWVEHYLKKMENIICGVERGWVGGTYRL